MPSQEYPWYSSVDVPSVLQQGDLLTECPVASLPDDYDEGDTIDLQMKLYDVVVMSQSCDLLNNNIDLVLVCPVWTFDALSEADDKFSRKSFRNQLLRGMVIGYHLLNKCELGGRTDFLVVDFRNVYGVPLNVIMKLATDQKTRIRLNPPYREHLSQAFARFFMRVGLPTDIPEF